MTNRALPMYDIFINKTLTSDDKSVTRLAVMYIIVFYFILFSYYLQLHILENRQNVFIQ